MKLASNTTIYLIFLKYNDNMFQNEAKEFVVWHI